MKQKAITAFCVCGLILSSSAIAKGERLPIKSYTTADGLANNAVNRILRDSRGFLWFCTGEGLSRFDGYSFTNYGVEQGLPSAIVNDLLETREGIYWVATAGGLCRFDPRGRPQADISNATKRRNGPGNAMFAVYFPGEDARSRYVLSLLQDRTGALWCGTRNGLYRVETSDEVKFAFVDLGIPDYLGSRSIECLLEDRLGTLWVGTANGLYRRWPDERVEAYTSRDGLPDNLISSLLEDREGHIWVGMRFGGLCQLVTDPAPGRKVVGRFYTAGKGLINWVNKLFQTSDGTLWAGSSGGLIRIIPTADGRDFRFRVYAEPHGLSYHGVKSLAEDRNENVWVGLTSGGAAKISRSGFTTFGKLDGFSWSSSILETRASDLLVVGSRDSETEWFINRFDEEKFIPIRPQFPETVKRSGLGWGWNQTVLEDHTGEWWIATGAGVCRFPKVSSPQQLAHTPPKAIYTTRDGLANNVILRLFEDSRGDIWIGQGQGGNGLSRWERSTGAFHHYTEKDNLPHLDRFFVSSFAEDRAGNLWIGFSGEGGLVRYRDGLFTLFTANDGVPAGQIRNMLIDSAGRLWVTSLRGGLSRIDDPSASRPTVFTYTTADGLSSNEISAVSEDQWGRIYISTGRGIDRLDPATGRVKHYTTADGLSLGEVLSSLRDHRGMLWFSSLTSVARLAPEPDAQPVPPPILITALRIAGETMPISALGEVEPAPIELGPDRNQLQIDFVALGFSPGEGFRYQYKLEGASEQWSHLADQRTVNFANLAPGRYRFLVQAMNADGVASETPASISFTVLSPIWRRWWFVMLAAVALGLTVYGGHRYRVARLVELARVRTRIATDLHDEIGSNLSLMAIVSDVANKRAGPRDSQMSEWLSLIAGTSRETMDAMADIVWVINPDKDRLLDLTLRMRRLADDIFTARNIAFHLSAPGDEADIKLGADTRHEVFMIFKESVNNIVRHSECTRADVEFKVEQGRLVLKLSDNGRGFDPASAGDGNGLSSMRRRAKNLGGELVLISSPGIGTTVILQAPLA